MAFRQMLALSGKKGAWTVSYEHLYQLFLVIVVFGSYYNALFGAFIWDDRAAIVRLCRLICCPHVRSPIEVHL